MFFRITSEYTSFCRRMPEDKVGSGGKFKKSWKGGINRGKFHCMKFSKNEF